MFSRIVTGIEVRHVRIHWHLTQSASSYCEPPIELYVHEIAPALLLKACIRDVPSHDALTF